MKHFLHGIEQFKNSIILFLSMGLFLAGIYICISAGILFFTKLNRNFFSVQFLVFFLMPIPLIICFSIYYVLLILKKIHYKKILSYSVVTFFIEYYLVSSTSHILPFLLLFTTIILLSCSHRKLSVIFVSSFLITMIMVILGVIKVYRAEQVKFLEVSVEYKDELIYWGMILIVSLITGLLFFLWAEWEERKTLTAKLKIKQITPPGQEIILLLLTGYEVPEIMEKVNISGQSALDLHYKNIQEKLDIPEVNKKELEKKVLL